jgi:hypothetical protein
VPSLQSEFYITKNHKTNIFQNFTDDENILVRFVEDVGATGGGDADE